MQAMRMILTRRMSQKVALCRLGYRDRQAPDLEGSGLGCLHQVGKVGVSASPCRDTNRIPRSWRITGLR
jgi:hypothetical protein